jgi:hypothetical protein
MSELRRVQREMKIADLRTKLREESESLQNLLVLNSALLTPEEMSIETAAAEYEKTAVPEILARPETQNIAVEYAGMRTLLKALRAERQKTRELLNASPVKPGAIDQLNAEFDHTLHAEWYPAWISWGLYSIDGLDIDDAPATVATLIESGPPELVEEIFKAIQAASGLSAVEIKNSRPLGTSSVPADEPTSNLTVTPAAPPDGIATETALSTSPSS